MKTDKKGFLLAEETLKIILAVIAIGFLAFLLASIYLNSTNNQKMVHAQDSLERIKDVIDNEDLTSEVVSEITPPGWSLFSFVDEKPNSCAEETCLCICDDVTITLLKSQLKQCDSKGVCAMVENLEDFGEIKIKKPAISIKVVKSEGGIIIQKNGY